MKINRLFKRVIATVCATSMVFTGMFTDGGTMEAQAAAEHTLWVVGDSTVSAFNDSYYYPRYGYGTQIGNYLDGTYEVQNLALSGRSSKSFLSESNYQTLANNIKAGDALIVGFGHNDEKTNEETYTAPTGDYTTEGSFAHSLYSNYVQLAENAGAEVILCTPIVRRTATGEWSDNNLHIANGGNYAQVIRDLGTAVDVPVVDLTTMTKDLYDELGASETLYLHAWSSNKEGSVDNTHLNIYGAKKVAWMLASAVKTANNTSLASAISLTAGEPTKANDLTSNPDYVEVVYDNNLKQSELFQDYVIESTGDGEDVAFKGTAFGNLGGNPSTANHILGTDENGDMHVAVLNDKGKITSTSDGIVMYYYKVPVGSSFTLSAKATVNAIDTTSKNASQVAFGLMARDDMWIDLNDSTIASDYVAAGTLGTGCNCFYRKSGALGGKVALTTETIAAGSSYELSIASTGDGYACTFGNEPTQIGGYDFQLTSVDSDYVYIGMFAARNADITYNNIYLVVDGKTIVDTRKTEYAVTVAESENGTAKASKSAAAEGETVELTATPDAGYYLKEWQVVSGDVIIEDDSFVMPAGAVEVKAVFEAYRTEWDFQNDSTIYGTNGVKIEGDSGVVAGLQVNADNGKWDSTATNGWVQVNANTEITIPVEGSCQVTINAYSTDYTVDGQAAAEKESTFTCRGKDNKVVLATTANTYLRSIKIVPCEIAEVRNIDVYDIGGKLETDTEKYTNNITPDGWLALTGNFADYKGKNCLIGGTTVFGDLTITHTAGDRLYTNVPALSALNADNSFGYAQNAYADGYTAAGAYYCNGTGGSNRRYLTLANVQAGDKVIVYAGSAGTAGTTFFFEGLGDASAQKDSVDVALNEYKKMEFAADYTGTYKIWENATGKPMYHRVVRVPGVAVSGTISAAAGENQYTGTEHAVKFVNQTTKKATWAELNEDGTFTATLTPGYTYVAVLVGATGYGFTVDSRMVVTTDDDALTGKENVNLVIEPKELYTYSGKITGFAEGYDVSKLAVSLIPPVDSDLLAADAAIDSNLNFTVSLEPDVDYTIQIAGVNDYEVTSETVINKSENYSADITVGLKPMYAVTGGFTGLGEGAAVTALSFENVEDGYTYAATVSADGYSINLRDGSYQAKATVSGYRTITHVVVKGAATSKDLMFVSTSAAPAKDWVSDIYVGYADKANNYATVREAVAACAAMNPTSEAQRITVHIAPGTYREQVVVSTPYVSFVNDTDEEVLLTWYYGVGFEYYSIADGYYDAERAYDKFEKASAADWGATVFVKPAATAFRAEGITFENSFNRYITDEELEDGVALDGSSGNVKAERNYSLDVRSKAATERAAAMVVKADKVEFKECSFLSSQDTLFTGNAAYNVYFKNCFIEGQTDYIFGDGSAVFDGCELSWYGYSTGSTGGYITAARPSSDAVGGYLFRNCVVTANDKLTVTPGYFGRPWGANAKVKFANTRLESADLIVDAGWYEMSGAKPEDANFYEYNTTDMSGTAVSTTGRKGNVADAATAATWTMESVLGSWVPAFYTAEEATVAFATAPFVTDNGDINTPYPGHKLTVGYSLGAANDANDASRIEWYRVKEGATDVLVKTSSANVDKTYKISSDDIGYQIKVVVTPITVSGTLGTAASCTVAEAVRDGYEDPDATGPDAVLGDGVNVFLVGDSTVKDYSAAGLNSGGKDRDEGAWGEYFQKFFNDEKVTVVNYANGGRSSRNFINEGSLDEVADKIGKGDYLFIQFGHNDCSNGADYLADRYVPLGEPDANGIYPTNEGTKVPTPTELQGSGYGDTCYTYDCGGTYKWYLLQYIEVAKNAGAIPVLVTPVSRMYYNSDGTIKPHHDSTDTTTGTQVTSNNAYVTAVKQLAEEQNVLLVDGFEITKKLFEDAYKAAGSDAYGKQIMHISDKTHNNKLGGVVEAAAIASAVQNMGIDISYAVKAPAKVMGVTTDSKTVFSINGSGVLTAYDITSDYVERATYWEGVGQDMIDAIGEKAAEFGGSEQEPGTGDGDDKGTNDGNDEGLKVRLANPDAKYVYTGSAIKPAIVVTNNGERLVAGVDYTVKYKNNVNASTDKATITVTGKGNIAGSTSETFEIQKKDIGASDIVEGSVVVLKNSKATPILLYNNKKLTSKDFDNADAKKKFTEDSVITIEGKGNFEGRREIAVKVVDKLEKFTVKVEKEKLIYDGTEKLPKITVTNKSTKKELEPEDYKVVYGGSTVNAGTVKFTVVGLGIYSGTVTKSYKISPCVVKDTTQMDVDASGVNKAGYGYTSKGVTIGDDLIVTCKTTGEVLTEGKDYKISYSGNKKVGTAKYTIKFQGNYKGSKSVKGEFTIVPAGLSDATDGLKIVLADQIYKNKPNVYKSKPIVDIDGVTLKASNYTVEYYKDAALTDKISGKNKVSLDAEDSYTTIYVKIIGKGNYKPVNGEYATAEYRVYAKSYNSLAKAKITGTDGKALKKVYYTGNEQKPEVKVWIKNGSTWEPVDADQYEVSYTNNVNKGKATIVVNGTGDKYAGSKTAKFSIVAQSLKDLLDLWK